MFQDSSLFYSKSFSDTYFLSFTVTDEFYDSLINENTSSLTFEIKDNIGSVINGTKIYNTSITYGHCNDHIVTLNSYEILCANKGSVTVKGRSTVIDREIEMMKSGGHQNDNRKRLSSEALEIEQPLKRKNLDKNIKNDPFIDLPRSQTNPTDRSPLTLKNRSVALELIKSGKTVKEVAQICKLPESTIKEFISAKAEFYQENSQEVLKQTKTNNRIPLVKSISNSKTNNVPIHSSEFNQVLVPDFFVNGGQQVRKKFKETVEIQIQPNSDDKLDINNNNNLPKPNPGKDRNKIKPPVKNNQAITQQTNKDNIHLTKQLSIKPNDDVRKSIVKDNYESRKPDMKKNTIKDNQEVRRDQSVKSGSMNKNSNANETASQNSSLITKPEILKHNQSASNRLNDNFTEPVRKQGNSKPIVNSNKRGRDTDNRKPPFDETKHRTSSHYPTEPYAKTQAEPIITTKALTEPKTDKNNNIQSSGFEYTIVNPATVGFSPAKNPMRNLVNPEPDSEEFRKDVLDTFYRLERCENIYRCYGDKREELKKRALESRTNDELKDLYKEYYQLVDEEKQPFFINLEKEITVLQEKLFEMSSIMGVTIST